MLEVRAVDQETGAPLVFSRVTIRSKADTIKTMTIVRDSIRLFVDSTVDLTSRASSVVALDRYGNTVDARTVTFSAPASYTVTNMLLTAKNETAGQLGVRVSDGRAVLTDSIPLRSYFDYFRTYTWTVAYACQDGYYSNERTHTNMFMSEVVTATLDSVSYRGDPSFNPFIGGSVADLWMTLDEVQTWENGDSTFLHRGEMVPVFEQTFDYVAFKVGSAVFSADRKTITGGNICSPNFATYTPAVFTRLN